MSHKATHGTMLVMVEITLTDMRLTQEADGSIKLFHDKIAAPLEVPRAQLERWFLRMIRQSLAPIARMPGVTIVKGQDE